MSEGPCKTSNTLEMNFKNLKYICPQDTNAFKILKKI